MIFHVLEVRVENCVAEVYLNDIPIIRRGNDYGLEFGGPVNQYMVNGLNRLEIVVDPGPVPAEALTGTAGCRQCFTPDKEARAWAALSTYPKGAIIDGPDREEIVALEWKPENNRPHCFPLVCSASIDLGEIYKAWQWQSAPRLTLDDETLREVSDFVIGMHGSLAILDFERYVELSKHRNEEGDFAYQKMPGTVAQQLLSMRGYIEDDPGWGMATLKPDEFSFRLCGNDRMIECVAKSGEPVLEELADNEGSISRYPMLLSKIDGEWLIVR